MGFDVSFHPIRETELKEWYFDALADEAKADELGARFGLDPFYVEKYGDTLRAGRAVTADESFDKTHAYYAAVAQGFFRTYFYIRGGAFTFVMEEKPEYASYTKPWTEILGREITQPAENRITENYCGGVYIPADQVSRLLAGIEENEQTRADMLKVFGGGTLDVFLKALRYAKENGLGILEATEVVEPNPMDLNASQCYSNLFNCDRSGPLLYAETATKQLAEATAFFESKRDAREQAPENKGGFFKKFFGRK